MNTTTDENASESAEKSPEKWLNIIAGLQSEVRALKAQLGVVRGMVVAASNTAMLWDEDGNPCWCGSGDEAHRIPHSDTCLQLRRMVWTLPDGLKDGAP